VAQILFYVKKLHRFAGLKLYVNLFGMIVISLLEGIGIFLLAPLLGLIGLLNSGAKGIPFVSWMAGPLQELPEGWKLPVILAVFIGLLAGQALLQRKQTDLNEELEQGFIRHLRLEMYGSLLRSNWSFFLGQRRSDLIHMMVSELPRASYCVYQLLRLLTTFLFTIVQIGLALWLSVPLTVFVLLGGIVLALYSRISIRKSRELGQAAADFSQSYIAGMTDQLNGMKEIKSGMLEERHFGWFRTLCYRMEQNYVRFTKLQSASQYYYKIAAAILMALFVLLAYEVLRLPAEKLVFVVIIFSRLWPRFSQLQTSLEQMAQSLPAFSSLRNLQEECEVAIELEPDDLESSESSVRIEQGMECRNVYYRYDQSHSSYALHHIDLRIPANRMTAIVGKSGAGKSTLIDILIGLVRPERGEVLLDGKPLEPDRAFALRRAVGYVAQDPFLFHATLRENLEIAAPHASEEQMWETLRFSASDEFVRNLPQGLDTVVGDRGVRLSGGERQRIVLARAILRKPSVLILDEATSALDSENEAHIQRALDSLKGSMTIIVIAHRLSTIRHADQVIVLDKGTIVQSGEYRQLSKDSAGMLGKLLEYQAVQANG
jgi:ATP-binding cassette subfamily C protein